MIFRIEELKKVCSDILYAVDNQSSFDNENVEIVVANKVLTLNVTNAEYFVSVHLDVDVEEDFDATVNATLFLNLISQLSTDTVEISLNDKHLLVKGNGEYKIPLIYMNEEMLHLKQIELCEDGLTTQANIGGDILRSVMTYNSKELSKGVASRPVQRLFYLDNNGAITFTTGACVNSFQVDGTFAVLLTPKVVKLFKLFGEDITVKFAIGKVVGYEDADVMGVRFETDNIKISALLPDNTMTSSVPVTAIRSMASDTKKFSVTLRRKEMSDALNRLLLFAPSSDLAFAKFACENDRMKLSLRNSSASEEVFYEGDALNECEYNMMLNLKDLKTTVDNFTDILITMSFGDNTSVVISRGNIFNIIPEVTEL